MHHFTMEGSGLPNFVALSEYVEFHQILFWIGVGKKAQNRWTKPNRTNPFGLVRFFTFEKTVRFFYNKTVWSGLVYGPSLLNPDRTVNRILLAHIFILLHITPKTLKLRVKSENPNLLFHICFIQPPIVYYLAFILLLYLVWKDI